MKNIFKTFILIFPFLFILIFLATFGILNTFFEQDEWLAIAQTIRAYSLPWWEIFIPQYLHFSPVGELFWRTLYKLFKLQAQYYSLTELLVHSAVSTLVYILTLRLTKNKSISILTALLFLLNGRAHQAFTNLAIFHVTDTALFFILSFFIFLSTIKEKIFSLKNILILVTIFLLAVSTREEGFIILPIFIAYMLFIDKSKLNRGNLIPFSVFSLGIFSLLALRAFVQTLYTAPIPVVYQITGNGAIYNLITLPLKLVIQNLINWDTVAMALFTNTHIIYPGVGSYFTSQSPIQDAAFFYISIVFISLLFFWVQFIKPKNIGKYFLFFSVWIFANAFMLSFVGRHLSTLEPRYLYFSAFPVFCFLAILIHSLYFSRSKYIVVDWIKKGMVIIIMVVMLIGSLKEIRVAVRREMHLSSATKTVLSNLKRVHPNLSKNTIFYIKCINDCHRNGDFGISDKNVLPFQSGPGMNFLVMYSVGHEKEWAPFFTEEFLFQSFSEGYKKIGDRSYGYFVTESKLEDTLLKNHLSKDIVVALEVDEKNFEFKDISLEFKNSLDTK